MPLLTIGVTHDIPANAPLGTGLYHFLVSNRLGVEFYRRPAEDGFGWRARVTHFRVDFSLRAALTEHGSFTKASAGWGQGHSPQHALATFLADLSTRRVWIQPGGEGPWELVPPDTLLRIAEPDARLLQVLDTCFGG